MERYSEYKDSGVQWIGEIPIHWRVGMLRSYLTLFSEKGHPNETLLSVTRELGVIKRNLDSKEENHNYIPDDLSGYKLVHKGDFVINKMKSWQGSYGVSQYQGIVSPAYYTCKLDNVDKKFFSRAIRSRAYIGFFASQSKGIRVGQWDLPVEALKQIPLIVPPLSEQKKIVSFLDNKISKIEEYSYLKLSEIKKIKEMIHSMIYAKSPSERTIIKSWETCFPNDWNLTLGRSLFEEVTIKGITDERFLAVTQDRGLIYKDTDDVNFVTAAKKETQKLVQPNQFVISLRSFEGGIEFSDKKGLVSPAYVILQLKSDYNTLPMQMYYRFLFKSSPFINRLNSISDSLRDGKSIKFKDIRNFLFPIPTDKTLQEILRLVKIYDIKREAFFKESGLLNEYKQRLISDVVTGQIKVC